VPRRRRPRPRRYGNAHPRRYCEAATRVRTAPSPAYSSQCSCSSSAPQRRHVTASSTLACCLCCHHCCHWTPLTPPMQHHPRRCHCAARRERRLAAHSRRRAHPWALRTSQWQTTRRTSSQRGTHDWHLRCWRRYSHPQ
jgi:hypothetical protein